MPTPILESPLARRIRALAIPRALREAALTELALAERFAAEATELGRAITGSIAALAAPRQGAPR